MRVLVYPGTEDCLNLGDVAMAQVAVRRLQTLWPGGLVQVFTDNPGALEEHCPGAMPVPLDGLRFWANRRALLGRACELLPAAASRKLVHLRERMRRKWPVMLAAAMRAGLRLRGDRKDPVGAFWGAVAGVDVVVACGQASLTDAAPIEARQLLGLAELALSMGKPIALFGQGVGPLEHPELREQTRTVLRQARLITLREGTFGPAILESLGVGPERVLVTGDEAIEVSYNSGVQPQENGIGVNVRLSRGAGLTEEVLPVLREALLEMARSYRARLIAVPISLHHSGTNDAEALRKLLERDSLDRLAEIRNPMHVIRQVARCRVLITGAYHAAVFALSQGIPAVCLAKSAFFGNKFRGLADQFGCGCELVFADRDLAAALRNAVDRAWRNADSVRAPLQRAAAQQVVKARQAYTRLAEDVPKPHAA
jgi:colanic acid/amylovoran biosynthesis protein